MVIDTVVGLGETCLLDGGEVEGVIPKINLVSEKCRPLSDCTHAAWEYGLFSELPQLYFVLHLQNAIKTPQIPHNRSAVVDEHQLVVHESRHL